MAAVTRDVLQQFLEQKAMSGLSFSVHHLYRGTPDRPKSERSQRSVALSASTRDQMQWDIKRTNAKEQGLRADIV